MRARTVIPPPPPPKLGVCEACPEPLDLRQPHHALAAHVERLRRTWLGRDEVEVLEAETVARRHLGCGPFPGRDETREG